MAILSQLYQLAGDLAGRPQIVETGLITDDDQTLREIRWFETGRVEVVALPRTSGLVAKALDGRHLLTTTIDTETFGRFINCLQLGKTQLTQFAPRQPIGTHVGRKILSYSRVWVSMED